MKERMLPGQLSIDFILCEWCLERCNFSTFVIKNSCNNCSSWLLVNFLL